MATAGATPLRPSRHIDALLALDADDSSEKVAGAFTRLLTTHASDSDHRPDR